MTDPEALIAGQRRRLDRFALIWPFWGLVVTAAGIGFDRHDERRLRQRGAGRLARAIAAP